jgi:hypothetical protein
LSLPRNGFHYQYYADLAGPWLLGAGPTFIFPTASNSRLGQNKWQIGLTGLFDTSAKMDRGRVSSTVVVGWRLGFEHNKSDESPVPLRVLSGRGLVSGHVAQHAGELVSEQERQHGHISDWRERKQGCEDWTVASEVRVPGAVHAGSSGCFRRKVGSAVLRRSGDPEVDQRESVRLLDFVAQRR